MKLPVNRNLLFFSETGTDIHTSRVSSELYVREVYLYENVSLGGIFKTLQFDSAGFPPVLVATFTCAFGLF